MRAHCTCSIHLKHELMKHDVCRECACSLKHAVTAEPVPSLSSVGPLLEHQRIAAADGVPRCPDLAQRLCLETFCTPRSVTPRTATLAILQSQLLAAAPRALGACQKAQISAQISAGSLHRAPSCRLPRVHMSTVHATPSDAASQPEDDPLVQVRLLLSLEYKQRSPANGCQVKLACAMQALMHLALLQYIVLRSDLWRTEGWPLGSVVAQV